MTENRISGIRKRLEIILVNKKKKKKIMKIIEKNQCPRSRECNKWGKKSDI